MARERGPSLVTDVVRVRGFMLGFEQGHADLGHVVSQDVVSGGALYVTIALAAATIERGIDDGFSAFRQAMRTAGFDSAKVHSLTVVTFELE